LLGVIAVGDEVPLSIDVAGGVEGVDVLGGGVVVPVAEGCAEGAVGLVYCASAVLAANAPLTTATASVSCMLCLPFMIRLLCVPRRKDSARGIRSTSYFFVAASAFAESPPADPIDFPAPDDVLPFDASLVRPADVPTFCLRAFSRAMQPSTSAAGTSEHARTASSCRFAGTRSGWLAGAPAVREGWVAGAAALVAGAAVLPEGCVPGGVVLPEGMIAGLGSGITGTAAPEGSALCAPAAIAVPKAVTNTSSLD